MSHKVFATIPIVLAGSMAVGFGLTGSVDPVPSRIAEKPKAMPSVFAQSIRVALAGATRVVRTTPPTQQTETLLAAAPTTYVVRAGDTVSSIAGHFGLATASVLALNGLGWKSVIYSGQQLKLTTSGALPVAVAPTTTIGVTRYTILPGDTMGSLAAKFGLQTATLLSANGLGWSSIIYAGQSIVVPSASPPESAPASVNTETAVALSPLTGTHISTATATTYVIKSGDTLSAIAASTGVTLQELLTANSLTELSLIFSGRSLEIPGSAASRSDISLVSSTTQSPNAEMTTNARTIISVGRSLAVPDYGIVIALAAALQESGLRNLHHGDLDSLGLFQQRPSMGWGTRAQVLNPDYSARLFFGGQTNPNARNTRGLLDVSGWQTMSLTSAAQAVQRSGHPTAYSKWEAIARTTLADLG